MMNESDRVKSKAMIDSSDSDSEMSDSEFQNVAKRPKLDLPGVSLVFQSIVFFYHKVPRRSPGPRRHRENPPPPAAPRVPVMSGINLAESLQSPSMIYLLSFQS